MSEPGPDAMDWSPGPPDDRYYDRQGQPISLRHWCLLLGDDEYKRVAEDVFVMGEPVRVSTVWLGLNHNWTGGPPLIFETMCFGGTHDLHAWRYTTEEQALEGHAEVVTLLQLELGAMDEHADDVRDEQQRGRPDPNGC